jgi:hypothetical protein
MDFARRLNLQPGDRIIVPLFPTEVTQHHAVYLGINNFEQEIIAENDATEGVRLATSAGFFKQHPKITRIDKFQGNEFQRQLVIDKAISLLGTQYDLFSYNCEHYANHILHGRPQSQQVRNFWGLCAIGFFTWLLVTE